MRCSGMFQDVPECSGMFHVPDFIDGPLRHPAYYLIRVYVKRGTHPEPTGTCRNQPEPPGT